MLEIFQFPDLHKEDLIMSWVDPFIIIAYNSRIKDKSVKEAKKTPTKFLKAKKRTPYSNSTFKAEENLMSRYYPPLIVSTFEPKNKHQLMVGRWEPNDILEFSDTFFPNTSSFFRLSDNVYFNCIRKQTE